MAELAFADATARGLYDVSDDEFRREQWFTQLDTGTVYQATAAGIGNWKVASGAQSARAETAAPSAGSLPIAGGTMTGDIAMGTHQVTGLGAPSAAADAVTKTYADTMLPKAGGTMTGDLVISAAKKIDLSALGVADAAFSVVATTDVPTGASAIYLKVLIGATPYYIALKAAS